MNFTAFILTLMGIYGTTVGAHRLWTHRTFKANTFLRFWLMICQTMAGQVGKENRKRCLHIWNLINLNFDFLNLITRVDLISHFLEVSILLFRGQSMTGFVSTGCTIKPSRHPMIHSTVTRISCILRFSLTLESWVHVKRNFSTQSTWKTLKKIASWCSKRDFIGFFTSSFLFCCQLTPHLNTGMTQFKLQSSLHSHCVISL